MKERVVFISYLSYLFPTECNLSNLKPVVKKNFFICILKYCFILRDLLMWLLYLDIYVILFTVLYLIEKYPLKNTVTGSRFQRTIIIIT